MAHYEPAYQDLRCLPIQLFSCLLLKELAVYYSYINIMHFHFTFLAYRGWLDGAMVLGKLPVPGHPTTLDKGRARAYWACSRCGLGLFE